MKKCGATTKSAWFSDFKQEAASLLGEEEEELPFRVLIMFRDERLNLSLSEVSDDARLIC